MRARGLAEEQSVGTRSRRDPLESGDRRRPRARPSRSTAGPASDTTPRRVPRSAVNADLRPALRPKGQRLAVVDYARAGAATKGEKPVPRRLRLRGSGPHHAAAAQPGTAAAATEVEYWDFRAEVGPDGTVPLLVVRPKRPKKGGVRRRAPPRRRPRVPDRR